MKPFKKLLAAAPLAAFAALFAPLYALAGEADVQVPEFSSDQKTLLYIGLGVCVLGLLFGLFQFIRIKKLRAHKSMLDVAATIYETCKAYLLQQGKFLAVLFVIVGLCVAFYFGALQGNGASSVLLILLWTVIGIAGSYVIAWYGMRVNTLANARMAFASLEKKPVKLLNIPLDAGMSIGVLLVCVELLMMLIILLFIPRNLAGACFIGFAVGESLGASALRICGGIFTKIADIGSDLMKIFFKIKEDDPRNPGVIADCTGDNAGDSVGPTADGFETYGVTGVAIVTFTCLAVGDVGVQAQILAWVFTMRVLMVLTSIVSFYINKAFSNARFGKSEEIDFEKPLTSLVWITSIVSIAVTFVASYVLLGSGDTVLGDGTLWWKLAAIISCGTLGAALIPEFTKIFTSTKSAHCKEVVEASRQGGASLNILAGLVAGNFSAFWKGMVFVLLMFLSLVFGSQGLDAVMIYPAVFAFGLVAFGFLSMGPVTIAVDSYGPVTDNAQSIYELSLIEEIPDVDKVIEKEFGFKPDRAVAKHYLEANDGAGNTFKATAKPVLIGTAVVGATIMIFSLILVIQEKLGVDPSAITSMLNPYMVIGFLAGGAVIYWFSGASIQAVSAGAYSAVEYIKENIELDENASSKAATEKSKEVVKICTRYAQNGMINIFAGIFCFALAFAFFSAPTWVNGAATSTEPVGFFIAYLYGLAFFGLFQAIFMANAGGCWDNAKKIVEVDLGEKDSPLHDAAVVGDTVGDPFKDTSSVSLNPIIKFSTLFGTLALEIALVESFSGVARYIGIGLFVVALVFVWRSFYSMRISKIKK
ncbi:K(+)-insensitive pyrophosphate-energized proton pump [Clostridia bacterium]|nr:K(+)-insensitive pyrophosphate-energized proton pump [Clostridia bacterium]